MIPSAMKVSVCSWSYHLGAARVTEEMAKRVAENNRADVLAAGVLKHC